MLSLGSHSAAQSHPCGDLMLKENLRDNPAAIAKYLTEIFEKNELGGILEAVKFALQARRMSRRSPSQTGGCGAMASIKLSMAGRTPSLAGFYRDCSKGYGCPNTGETTASKRGRPPRPKLGRPLSSSRARKTV